MAKSRKPAGKPAEKPATPKPSAGARFKAAGKRAILLGVTPEQKELIERAAEADGRNQSQFIIYHAVAAARKLLGEKPRANH